MSRRHLAVMMLVVVAGGLALRSPQLSRRPMHGDEAVHAVKCNQLWDTGRYVYDPHQFHGPTLYYFTLPLRWLSGAADFADTTVVLHRLVPVLFGVGLILLLLLIADGLGRPATAWAALLTALSPALVFYSRYYIQETLLAFFTFAAIVAGWRYTRTRRIGWALLAGGSLGLMHATKETCVIAYACMAAALLSTLAWLWGDRAPVGLRAYLRPGAVAGTVAVAVIVSALLFSGFLTNLRGPLDSLLAYGTYFRRSGGNGLHDHPWYYYLQTLAFTKYRGAPLWSEGLILLLAALGAVAALWRKSLVPLPGVESRAEENAPTSTAGTEPGRCTARPASVNWGSAEAHVSLLRFLALYTLLMTLAYAVIPYKTPWCMVQFLQPMALLAGVGTVALFRWLRPAALRAGVCILLAAAAAHLGWQAYLANFPYCADRRNPYVYAHPVRDVEHLTAYIEKLAKVHPQGRRMRIHVIAENCWPLPWYLRGFEQVGYWERPPNECDAPVVIVSEDLERATAQRLRSDYESWPYDLRPDVSLVMHVERELYEAFAAREEARASAAQEGSGQ